MEDIAPGVSHFSATVNTRSKSSIVFHFGTGRPEIYRRSRSRAKSGSYTSRMCGSMGVDVSVSSCCEVEGREVGWGRLNMVSKKPDVARNVYEWIRYNVPWFERRTTSALSSEKHRWYVPEVGGDESSSARMWRTDSPEERVRTLERVGADINGIRRRLEICRWLWGNIGTGVGRLNPNRSCLHVGEGCRWRYPLLGELEIVKWGC